MKICYLLVALSMILGAGYAVADESAATDSLEVGLVLENVDVGGVSLDKATVLKVSDNNVYLDFHGSVLTVNKALLEKQVGEDTKKTPKQEETASSTGSDAKQEKVIKFAERFVLRLDKKQYNSAADMMDDSLFQSSDSRERYLRGQREDQKQYQGTGERVLSNVVKSRNYPNRTDSDYFMITYKVHYQNKAMATERLTVDCRDGDCAVISYDFY